MGLIFFRSNFLLALVLIIGVSAGLAPLVYLYGASRPNSAVSARNNNTIVQS